MLYVQPLFPGESGVDQLVEIIKVQFLVLFYFHPPFSALCASSELHSVFFFFNLSFYFVL